MQFGRRTEASAKRASSDPTPMKPGNAGGGKGPQLKTDASSNEGQGIDDESSRPELCSEVADSVTCSMLRAMECVSFPRAGCGKSACPVR